LLEVLPGDLYIVAATRTGELDTRPGNFFIGDTEKLIAASTPDLHAAWPPDIRNHNRRFISTIPIRPGPALLKMTETLNSVTRDSDRSGFLSLVFKFDS
jgi:hypothetical protein